MKNIAVVVSDLHMGFNPRMDNFAGDGRWLRFCERLVQFCREKQAELTFILAGDVFEMWEMAPEDETLPETAAAHITANLFFPAVDLAAVQAASARGKWQIDQALARHPEFAQGIGRLLAGGAALHYLPGNHDHAMTNPVLQQHLRDRLAELTGRPVGEAQLPFAHWVALPELKLYVEHGHQFADGDSSYRDVSDWKVEAPGYYFLRYIYSRLEGLPDLHVPFAELVRVVLNLIFHPQVIDHTFKRYLYEYFAGHEAVGFPMVQGPTVPLVGPLIPAIYHQWKACGKPLDRGPDELAEDSRKLASQAETDRIDGSGEFAQNLTGYNVKKPRVGLPGRLVNYTSTHSRDRYAMGFRKRFEQAAPPFPQLAVTDGMTVIAGHTHREHHSRLLDAFMATVRYINCGSWASGADKLVYAAVTDDRNEFRNRLLYRYRSS